MIPCPQARLSCIQYFNMGHNGYGINLHGVLMIPMDNIHAWDILTRVLSVLIHQLHAQLIVKMLIPWMNIAWEDLSEFNVHVGQLSTIDHK